MEKANLESLGRGEASHRTPGPLWEPICLPARGLEDSVEQKQAPWLGKVRSQTKQSHLVCRA